MSCSKCKGELIPEWYSAEDRGQGAVIPQPIDMVYHTYFALPCEMGNKSLREDTRTGRYRCDECGDIIGWLPPVLEGPLEGIIKWAKAYLGTD